MVSQSLWGWTFGPLATFCHRLKSLGICVLVPRGLGREAVFGCALTWGSVMCLWEQAQLCSVPSVPGLAATAARHPISPPHQGTAFPVSPGPSDLETWCGNGVPPSLQPPPCRPC